MASTDARMFPSKNVAYRMAICFRKNDGTLIIGWTGADTELSLDGAAFADATNEATEIGTSGCGYLDLTSAELNADMVWVKSTVTNTDALPLAIAIAPQKSTAPVMADLEQINGVANASATLTLTGLVTPITGNVTGNLSGSVGSVGANGITATSLDATASAEIADAVWDEALAGHVGAGSTGEALNAAGSAGDPWTTALPGAYSAGQAGHILGTNLDVVLSTRASAAALTTVDTVVDGIAVQTTQLLTDVAAVPTALENTAAVWDALTADYDTLGTMGLALGTTSTGYTVEQIATAVWTLANGVEVGWTPQQSMRILMAYAAGLVSGADTGLPIFRAVNNTAARITATTDSYGNRTVVTLTP